MAYDPNRYQRNFSVSWEQLHRDTRALAWRLHDMQISWDTIVAVTRGGLVPAAIIARELSIFHIDTVCITSYDWQHQVVPPFSKKWRGTAPDVWWWTIWWTPVPRPG